MLTRLRRGMRLFVAAVRGRDIEAELGAEQTQRTQATEHARLSAEMHRHLQRKFLSPKKMVILLEHIDFGVQGTPGQGEVMLYTIRATPFEVPQDLLGDPVGSKVLRSDYAVSRELLVHMRNPSDEIKSTRDRCAAALGVELVQMLCGNAVGRIGYGC